MSEGGAMNCIFDTDFDAERVHPAPPEGAAEDKAHDISAIREAAHAKGYAAGLAAARSEDVRAQAELLATLSRDLAALQEDAAAHRAALEVDALDFARAACERIAPELVAALGTDRAATEVRRCLALVVGRPRIDVALSPAALARHGEALAPALEAAGPEGGAVLRADPELADGDARVRWDDGEMTYSMDEALAGLLGALRARGARSGARGRTSDG